MGWIAWFVTGLALLAGPAPRADRPAPRTDENSMIAHRQLLDKARAGGIDVYFVGDLIARPWGATDYPELLGPPAATDHAPPPTGDPSAAAARRTL